MNKFRERQVSMSQQHDKDKVKQCTDVQKASGAVTPALVGNRDTFSTEALDRGTNESELRT